MLLPILTAAVSAAYGRTPQSVAQQLVYSINGSKIVIVRTNIVGPYATVLIRGGYLEGSPTDEAAFLLKQYSFGWQGLESLNFRCRLESHVRSLQVRTRLMRGMPSPINERACGNGNRFDTGPRAAVDQIRKLQRGPLVPAVIISGNFALAGWYGAGGGETLFERHGNRWHIVTRGGGALGVAEMRQYGVPKPAWCVFGTYDAACTARR